MSSCPYCGTSMREGDNFCGRCGKRQPAALLPTVDGNHPLGPRTDTGHYADLVRLQEEMKTRRVELMGNDFTWNWLWGDVLSDVQVHQRMVKLQRQLEEMTAQNYLTIQNESQQYYVKRVQMERGLRLAREQLEQETRMVMDALTGIAALVDAQTDDETVREEMSRSLMEYMYKRLPHILGQTGLDIDQLQIEAQITEQIVEQVVKQVVKR
jgi:hypothetical protein